MREGPDVESEGISAYTLADMADYVKKEFGISLHVETISKIIRREGLSRQKARPQHPKTDPALQEAFKKSPRSSFQPIHIFEGNSGKPILSLLRPGKRPCGEEIERVLRNVIERTRSRGSALRARPSERHGQPLTN